MQPEVQAALIAAVAALIVSVVNAGLTYKTRVIMLEVKNFILTSEASFIQRLNGTYLRKPDLDEDYPMTRREGRAIEEKVDTATACHEEIHNRIEDLNRHIKTTRFALKDTARTE